MSTLNKECIICKTVEKFFGQSPQLGAAELGFFTEKQ